MNKPSLASRWNFSSHHSISRLLIVLSLLLLPVCSQLAETIVWQENFDAATPPDDWDADRGAWEFGQPTNPNGPRSAHNGTGAISIGRTSNYANNVSSVMSRLTSFTVPAATENPRLRFWHWFAIPSDSSCFNDSGDYGEVVVRTNGGAWESVSSQYSNNSDWSRASVSLGAFAGLPVQVGFRFRSGGCVTDAGWFIDEVQLVTGAFAFAGFEDFEGGLGDWAPTRGNWAVLAPTNGPGRAHQGSLCAAITAATEYPDNTDTILASPRFTVPAASENPRLRFWHWFAIPSGSSCFNDSGDYGEVVVRTNGGAWESVSSQYSNNSDWSRASVSLGAFAGLPVQVGFRFWSGRCVTDAGWFIDEVQLVTGAFAFAGFEDFEGGLGDWAPTRGNWAVLAPTNGPGQAHQGSLCVAVTAATEYPDNADTILASPRFTVPAASENPRLRFWHWFAIPSGSSCFNDSGDYGEVVVRTNSGDWESISSQYSNNSDWSRASVSLVAFAGLPVQVGFRFRSGRCVADAGWFIDEVEIIPRSTVTNRPPTAAVASIGGTSAIIAETSPFSVLFTASDPDAGQTLSFSLDAGFPAGAAITAGGLFTWTPTEAQGPGTNAILVRVTDNGTPALSATNSFIIVVTEANLSPVLASLPNRVIDEGATLDFTASATDPDLPAQTLAFSLASGAPAGAAITPAGRFTWTPTEAQGPSTNAVTLRVSDGVSTSESTFSITVREANQLPTLSGVEVSPLGAVAPGSSVQIRIIAADSDLPAQSLVYSLTGLPDSATGVFTWIAVGSGTVNLTARVSDGSASATRTVSIEVTRPANTPPTISTNIASQRVDPDRSTPWLAFNIGDVESASDRLQVRAVSSNTNVVPADCIFLFGTNAQRYVMVKPLPGASGATTVTLTVTDEGGLQASHSFGVQLCPCEGPFLELDLYAIVTVHGAVGRAYRIESAPDADGPWTEVGRLLLERTPELFIDFTEPARTQKLYRATLVETP